MGFLKSLIILVMLVNICALNGKQYGTKQSEGRGDTVRGKKDETAGKKLSGIDYSQQEEATLQQRRRECTYVVAGRNSRGEPITQQVGTKYIEQEDRSGGNNRKESERGGSIKAGRKTDPSSIWKEQPKQWQSN